MVVNEQDVDRGVSHSVVEFAASYESFGARPDHRGTNGLMAYDMSLPLESGVKGSITTRSAALPKKW